MFEASLRIQFSCTVSVEGAAFAADRFQFTVTRSLLATTPRKSEHLYFDVFLSAQSMGLIKRVTHEVGVLSSSFLLIRKYWRKHLLIALKSK